jgi:hypothetical protein
MTLQPHFGDTMTTRRTTLTVAITAIALVGTLAGCSAGGNERDRTFSTTAAAQKADAALPGFVQQDATDIRFDERRAGYGAWIRWDADGPITATYCTAGREHPKAPTPDAAWWPEKTPAKGTDCAQWRVFGADGHFYAWDSRLKAS